MALTERLAIVLETVGANTVARDLQKVGSASKGLAGNVNQTTGTLGKLKAGFGELSGAALSGAGLAALGTGLVGFALSSVNAFDDLALSVQNVQRVIGGTAEDASRLVAVSDDVGISVESLTTGMFQLTKRVDDSGKTLASFGVQIATNADGTTNMLQTLLSVGDAYKALNDPVQQANLLTAAFGKQGTALIPILERDRGAIESMFQSAESTGQILSQDDIAKAQEYRESMDDLGDAWKELQLRGGQVLVPFLTDVANGITKLSDLADRVTEFLHIDPAESSFASGGGIGAVLDQWKNKIFGLKPPTDDAKDSINGLAEADRKARDAAEEHIKALDQISKSLTQTAQADRALDQSQRGLATARDDLNDLLKEGAVDEEKVADAVRSHAAAIRSLNGAQRDQQRAQEDYNDALSYFQLVGGDDAADELAEKRDKLADANDSVANSQDRVKDTQADLDKARAGDPDYQEKLAAARQKVADAEYEVSQNTLASITAHDDAAAAIKGHAGEARQLLAEYDGLIARAPQVAAALDPILALLQASGIGPGFGTSTGQTRAPGRSPAPAQPILAPPPTAGNLSPVTNNTFNINASDTIDPMNLARNIVWNLN